MTLDQFLFGYGMEEYSICIIYGREFYAPEPSNFFATCKKVNHKWAGLKTPDKKKTGIIYDSTTPQLNPQSNKL
jgi:hypothetical protein